MKNSSILLMVILFSFVFNAQSQQLANPIDHALLNIYSQLYVYPQEKVYVQTDRPYYLTGERMFFRAFLLHASTLKPSTLSRYVYVELISPLDTAVLRTKIRIDESNLFYGSLLLPESLPEGHYRLRSYTRYMENMGEAYFFTRPVYIADPKSAVVEVETEFDYSSRRQVGVALCFKDKQQSSLRVPQQLAYKSGKSSKTKIAKPNENGRISVKYDVEDANPSRSLLISFQDTTHSFKKYIRIPHESSFPEINFYPEGGNLIAGTNNRIAFKALLPGARTAEVEGSVFNSKHELQTTFSTLHDGMGSFDLEVKDGESYYASCRYNGLSNQFKLPAPQSKALSLQALWDGDSLSVSVLSANEIAAAKYYLLIHHQGVPVYLQEWDGTMQHHRLAKKLFKTGVSHLLLLTDNFHILSERMVFNNLHDEATITVNFTKDNYSPREHVVFDISLPQAASDTVPVSYAIAITDDKDIELDTTTNIVAEILLRSELEGTVHHPAWYFGNDRKVPEAADLLMLTHGWRRYFVSEALQAKLEKPLIRPERSQSFSGLLKRPNQRPYKKGKVQLTAIGYGFSEAVEADQDGRFEFSYFEFPDSTAYQLLSYANERTQDVEIHVDTIMYPPSTIALPFREQIAALARDNTPDFLEFVEKANRKYVMENGMRQIDLPEFTVTANKKLKRIENDLHLPAPDRGVPFEDMKNNPPRTFEDLFYRIPGVNDVSDAGIRMGSGYALIVLNGIVRDYSTLIGMVDIGEIAQVDVYIGYGITSIWRTFSPVFVITTWPSNTWGNQAGPAKNVKTVLPLGYQKPVEFYAPRYDSPDALTAPKADLRSTIYWQPNVQTEKDLKTSIDFYAADTPTTYSIVIEGIGPGRKLIYYRKNAAIKVEKSIR